MKVSLSEIAIEYKNNSKPTSDTPLVGLEHIDPEKIELKRWDVGKETTFTKNFKKGHVLFGRRRAYLKKACYSEFDGVCSGDITIIEAKQDKINPLILPFIIQNDKLFDFAMINSAGSLSPRVKWENLSKFRFELPDMNKQNYLAELLWSMENLERDYENIINQYDILIKAKYHDFQSNYTEYTTIGNIIDNQIQTIKKKTDGDNKIRYIEISSINSIDGTINFQPEVYVKDAPSSAKYTLNDGDIIVSLVRPNLRKNCIVRSSYNNVVGTSGFCVLRPKKNLYEYYLLCIVNSEDFVENMIKKATGAMYPTLKNSDVYDYKIKDIPDDDISVFSEEVQNLHLQKEEYKTLLNKIKEAKKELVYETFFSNIEEE